MKDHSRVYHGCSAGVVSACVGVGRYSLISDTEPEVLQNSLSAVSAVECPSFRVIHCGHS